MGGFAANPRALSGCDYMMNKKQKNTLLLSACKGNENLMRLDFSFFFFLLSAFAAIRLSTRQQVRGETLVRPFLHGVR